MKRAVIFVLAVAAVAAASAQAQQSPAKRRVAVMNFDYGTVSSSTAAIFGGQNIDVGKGIADILVDKLVSSGVYQVYERKALEKIMTEQNISNSDRFNPATAARLGQLIGVDAIIIGSVTQFGRDDRSTEVGAVGRALGKYGISGVGKKESKAVVAVTARLVSVDTGEIMASSMGTGESKRSGAALLGSGGGSTGMGGGYYDMASRNFASTILGEATVAAVDQVARNLDGQANRVTARTIQVQGTVADVSGDSLVINVGTKAGVKLGDRLEVVRKAREIKDPESGRVIKRVTDAVGTVTITEADDLSATGKFSGPQTPQVGDLVRTPQGK
jgi:curli biogenesis system outer membrane secretion channel CsgG